MIKEHRERLDTLSRQGRDANDVLTKPLLLPIITEAILIPQGGREAATRGTGAGAGAGAGTQSEDVRSERRAPTMSLPSPRTLALLADNNFLVSAPPPSPPFL